MPISEDLIQLISKVVNIVLDKKLARVPKTWVAKVIETSGSISIGGTAQVYLNGDSAQPPISVLSKSSQTLVANDECYLFSPSGSLNDIVILYKK